MVWNSQCPGHHPDVSHSSHRLYIRWFTGIVHWLGFIHGRPCYKHDPLDQTLGCSAVIIVIETELTILAKPPIRSTTPGWSIFNVTKIQTNRSFCHVSKTHFVHTCACLTNQVWQEEDLTVVMLMLDWCNQVWQDTCTRSVLFVNMGNTWTWRLRNLPLSSSISHSTTPRCKNGASYHIGRMDINSSLTTGD